MADSRGYPKFFRLRHRAESPSQEHGNRRWALHKATEESVFPVSNREEM